MRGPDHHCAGRSNEENGSCGGASKLPELRQTVGPKAGGAAHGPSSRLLLREKSGESGSSASMCSSGASASADGVLTAQCGGTSSGTGVRPHDGGPSGSSSNSSEGGVGLRRRTAGGVGNISCAGCATGAGAGGGGNGSDAGLRLGDASGDELIVLDAVFSTKVTLKADFAHAPDERDVRNPDALYDGPLAVPFAVVTCALGQREREQGRRRRAVLERAVHIFALRRRHRVVRRLQRATHARLHFREHRHRGSGHVWARANASSRGRRRGWAGAKACRVAA